MIWRIVATVAMAIVLFALAVMGVWIAIGHFPGFLAHGHCYAWNPAILSVSAVSDGAIAFAYFGIPVVLVRSALLFPRGALASVLWLFAAFVLACGVCHVFDLAVIWWPYYRLFALVKAVTALISLVSLAVLGRTARGIYLGQLDAEQQETLQRLRRIEQTLDRVEGRGNGGRG